MFASVGSRILNSRVSVIRRSIQKHSAGAVIETKNEEGPQYPPILDTSWTARSLRKHQEWYDAIQKLQTVEEKLIKLNMPRYYGWRVILYEEDKIPYDSLRQAQHATRTHVVNTSGLPSYYDNIINSEELDSTVESIRKQIEDIIIFEHCSRKRRHELKEDVMESAMQMENIVANAVASQVHRVLSIHLASKLSYIIESQVEFEPRIESCWSMGGVPPAESLKKRRLHFHWPKECVDYDLNMWIQYLGHPILHIRHRHPLEPILPLSECEDSMLEVPLFNYDPRMIGYAQKRRHITCIPGFWPGDACKFGLLSYHNRGHILENPYSHIDDYEILTTQAVLASFSWLNAQVFYQGFSMFHDVTYPLVSQAIVTNSQWWSFYVYQLNTTLVHSDHVYNNPRRNICWASEPIKLYDKIEGEKIHGFNDEVLKRLIKMYMNSPKERENVSMSPYLGESVKIVADMQEEPRREWLEECFKHLVSNRSRHKRIPEIYAWQKIYLVDNKLRPRERRLTPFQKGIDIYRRTLDDHLPPYIPRKLRDPRPSRKKHGRFAPTFYP